MQWDVDMSDVPACETCTIEQVRHHNPSIKNPWGLPAIRLKAKQLYVKYMKLSQNFSSKEEILKSVDRDLHELVQSCASGETEGIYDFAGHITPIILGEGNLFRCKILVINNRITKREAEKGCLRFEESFYVAIENVLVQAGVDRADIYHMPLLPVHTGVDTVPKSAASLLWPFVALKIRIMKPLHAICFNRDAAVHFFRKFSSNGSTNVQVNVTKPVDLADVTIPMVYIQHPFTISGQPMKIKTQEVVLQKIGEKIGRNKRVAEGESPAMTPEQRLMKRRKCDGVINITHGGSWLVDNNIHISPPLRDAESASIIVSCAVRLVVNINAPAPNDKLLKAHGSKKVSINYQTNFSRKDFFKALPVVWRTIKENKRVAVYCSTGYGPSNLFAAAVFLLKNPESTVEEAVLMLKEKRDIDIDEEGFKMLQEAKIELKNFI